MAAPVCHIPPENASIPQPGVRNLPGIPIATDLRSLYAAVNAMRQTILIITNQQDTTGANNFSVKPDPNAKKQQWLEVSRVVEKVKVYQNNDPSTGNFVEIERINKLTMGDKNTGQQWTWDRERK